MRRILVKMKVHQKERGYKIGFFVMVILFYALLSLVSLYVFFPTSNQGSSKAISHSYLDINFMDDFTDDEGYMLRRIAYDLDPKYSQFIKQINFTKDLSYVRDYCNSGSRPEVVGCNLNDKILLHYDEDYSKAWMKEGICHETLHSIIYGGEKTHSIIYSLGDKGVCFK